MKRTRALTVATALDTRRRRVRHRRRGRRGVEGRRGEAAPGEEGDRRDHLLARVQRRWERGQDSWRRRSSRPSRRSIPGTKVEAGHRPVRQAAPEARHRGGRAVPCPDVVRIDIIWVPELADLGVLVPLSEALPGLREAEWADFDGPPGDQRLQGQALRAAAGHQHQGDALQRGDAQGRGRRRPAPDVRRAARRRAQAREAQGLPPGGGRRERLERAPVHLVQRRRDDDKEHHEGDGYLNGPKSVEAVQLLVDLYKARASRSSILGGAGATPHRDGLAKGKYATMVDGPWTFPTLEKQYPKFEMKGAPIPKGDGDSVSVVGGESVVDHHGVEEQGARRGVLPVPAQRRRRSRPWPRRGRSRCSSPEREDDRDRALLRART